MAAVKKNSAKAKQEQPKAPKWELTRNQRWVLGVALLGIAAILLTAIVSYFFYWQDDQSFVRWQSMLDRRTPVKNPVGNIGAFFAHFFVTQCFGVFAVTVPAVIAVLAVRLIRNQRDVLRKSVRITVMATILGSVSLGYLFDTKWDMFGSGLGGEHGIYVAEFLKDYIGVAGTGIVLVVMWMLLAVYANRKAIGLFNSVGKGIIDGGSKVGGVVLGQASDLIHNRGADGADKGRQQATDGDDKQADNDKGIEGEANGEANGEARASGTNVTQVELKVEDFDYGQEGKSAGEGVSENTAGGRERQVAGEGSQVKDNGMTSGSDIEIVYAREEDSGEVATTVESVGGQAAGTGVAGGSGGVFTVVSSVSEEGESVKGGAMSSVGTADDGGNVVVLGSADDSPFREDRSSGRATTSSGGNGSQSGAFEVVTAKEGGVLSAGGVVESVSEGGVSSEGGMTVVMAGRNDAQLEDGDIDESLYDPTKELSKYQRPPVELLEDHKVEVNVTEEEIYANKNQIVKTLENFGIKIDKIKATIGPTVTLYEIVPAPGVKISKIKNLEDDIALSLKALGIRIIAPMPGQGTVGIEVPNKDKEVVSLYSVIKTKKFQESDYELPVVLGRTISNETFVIDLVKMPHLLVAGATGQGKSVGLNAIINSLLYKKHPAELKFVLVDPKRVELSLYSRLEKHFLAKMMSEEEAILTDTQRVVYTLNALCQEMSDRYDLLRAAEVKKISEYNDKFLKRRLNPNKGHKFMPYIVVVVDEFADMIMTAGREVETPITRLAQLARAVGIHLVIATQRPDVKVITGLIKANFPARIAFRVMSMVDSRTIIDQPGANQLIGRGDMLMSLNGELTRVQCAFVDTPEIERVVEFISNQRGYPAAFELPDYTPEGEGDSDSRGDIGPLDSMFEEVAYFIVQNQQGSTSSIQRRFSIGYNRAGRIMDQMESAGIVGRAEGSKPREVLITDVSSLEYILQKL